MQRGLAPTRRAGGGGGGGGWRTLHTKCHPVYPCALPVYLPTMGIPVQTEGGAHARPFVATAGVLLFKGGAGAGPRVECSEPWRLDGWRTLHTECQSVYPCAPLVGGGGLALMRRTEGGGMWCYRRARGVEVWH